jgi:hypothetical protein
MPQPKADRRTQRTKRNVQKALLTLLDEKAYEEITVQEILDRADVGRSTFYKHYQDKEDLLLRGVAGLSAEHLPPSSAPPKDRRHQSEQEKPKMISVLGMFQHVKGNLALHRLMFDNAKDNTLREKGTAFLYENIHTQLLELKNPHTESSVPLEVCALYMTHGLMSLVKWWVDHKMTRTPEEMNAMFQQMAMPGLQKILGRTS